MGRAATRLLIVHNWVQKILSSHLLSKNITIKIYINILLNVILYGCETWFFTLWEEHGLSIKTSNCGQNNSDFSEDIVTP